MILIKASTPMSVARIVAAMPRDIVSHGVTEWQDVYDAVAAAGCLVLELDLPDAARFSERVRMCRAIAPDIAIVAVAPLHADSVRCALRSGVDDFVAVDAVSVEAWHVIDSARARTLYNQVVHMVRSSIHLRGPLCEAMIISMESGTLPRSSAALARSLGISRSKLYRAVTSASLSGTGEHAIRAVLDWIALTHCVARKRRNLSWDAVARQVGVDLRTLRTMARRRIGVSLTELEGPGHRTFLDACRHWTSLIVFGADDGP